MNNPITAIKISTRHGEIVVDAMTQSPRGTRVLLRQLKAGPADASKQARNSALASAIAELLAIRGLPL